MDNIELSKPMQDALESINSVYYELQQIMMHSNVYKNIYLDTYLLLIRDSDVIKRRMKEKINRGLRL